MKRIFATIALGIALTGCQQSADANQQSTTTKSTSSSASISTGSVDHKLILGSWWIAKDEQSTVVFSKVDFEPSKKMTTYQWNTNWKGKKYLQPYVGETYKWVGGDAIEAQSAALPGRYEVSFPKPGQMLLRSLNANDTHSYTLDRTHS